MSVTRCELLGHVCTKPRDVWPPAGHLAHWHDEFIGHVRTEPRDGWPSGGGYSKLHAAAIVNTAGAVTRITAL